MSIFGPQNKKVKNINELNKKVQRLVNIERRFSDFQHIIQNQSGAMLKEINDHGDKVNTLKSRVNEIEISQDENNVIQRDEINTIRERHNTLKDRVNIYEETIERSSHTANQFIDETIPKISNLEERVKEIAIEQHFNTKKVANLEHIYNELEQLSMNKKSYITITAESKGSLKSGEIFSFGNAGKSAKTGYVMMMNGIISKMSVCSDRSTGDIKVQVFLNSSRLIGSLFQLKEGVLSDFRIFDKPLNVTIGDIINFVTWSDNNTTINTVASVLIELD